jgi:uncharacterized protein (DUF1697 family)
MPRFVAFLRAVNVGGRTVKMETLRGWFSDMGFTSVETFIASGNVIFEAKSAAAVQLEKKIEAHLADALGYSVSVFLRTASELSAISAHQPFAAAALQSAQALNIGFCKDSLTPAAITAVMALATPIDDFHVHGRELYWLCRHRQSESTFSNQQFERAIKGVATLRSATTIAKLASKYCA